MIGLLVTSRGIPIAHHVFAANTADVSILPGVMEDLKSSFDVGLIALSRTGTPPHQTPGPSCRARLRPRAGHAPSP